MSHFGFTHKPFQISTDPRFLWLGEKHDEALAILKYGVLDNRGFLLLTGDVGTGKTTLVNKLLASLGKDVVAATVPDPRLGRIELLNYISAAFGMEERFKSKGGFLVAFEEFLRKEHSRGKTVLLVIDEAQRLSQDLLEEIRLLSNIETPEAKLLNVFFVGQDEFTQMLLEDQNRPVRQRITISYHIEPLTREETQEYIRFRVEAAGAEQNPFSRNAVDAVWTFSEGYPRLINIICDHALLTAYVSNHTMVSGRTVDNCAKELKLELPPPALSEVSGAESSQAPTESAAGPPSTDVPPGEQGKRKMNRRYLWALFVAVLIGGAHLAYVSLPKLHLLQNSITKPATSEEASVAERTTSRTDRGKPGVPGGSLPEEGDAGERQVKREKHAETGVLQPPVASSDRSPDTQPAGLSVPDKTTVHFEHDSYTLDPESIETLERIGDLLTARPELKARLTGYTDSRGNRRYNFWVSEFRANIVKSFLVGRGVAPERLQLEAMGPLNPVAENTTREGREQNRRVEIELTKPRSE